MLRKKRKSFQNWRVFSQNEKVIFSPRSTKPDFRKSFSDLSLLGFYISEGKVQRQNFALKFSLAPNSEVSLVT
jgi:hypothetical protein